MYDRFLRQFQQQVGLAPGFRSPGRPDPNVDSQRVQSFLESMEPVYRSHPLFADCSDDDIEAAMEARFGCFTTMHSFFAASPLLQCPQHSLNS